ncbi:hypothetical protein Tco_1214116 [Tanacetum coccineum]
MASSMIPKLEKTFENTWAYEMNQPLKEMFQAKASKERLDVVKSLMACKPKPRASIYAFVLEMKGYFDILEYQNMVFYAELSINIIISGLPADYNQFVLSYQMNRKETSIMELHSLLQTAEKTSHSNWKGKTAKGKSDRGSKRKAESKIAPTSDPKEVVYFYCNTKRGIGRGLKESRRLKHVELNLVIGNKKIMHVTRIGNTFHRDEILLAEEQPLPAAASPTADSPGYVPESDPEEEPEANDDEDPEEDPAELPF